MKLYNRMRKYTRVPTHANSFNISTRKGNRLVCRSIVKIMEDELYKDLRHEKVDNKQVTKAERFAKSNQEI